MTAKGRKASPRRRPRLMTLAEARRVLARRAGKARLTSMTREERQEVARAAARARWAKR